MQFGNISMFVCHFWSHAYRQGGFVHQEMEDSSVVFPCQENRQLINAGNNVATVIDK